MKREELEQYARQKGWKWAGRSALTIWRGGFPVSLTCLSNGAVSAVVRAEPMNAARKAAKALRREWKGACTISVTNVGVTVVSRSRQNDTPDRLGEVLDALTAALMEGGCVRPDRCPVCRKGGCDSAVLTREGLTPAHAACIHAHADAAAQAAEDDRHSGSYLAGFLGALVGGFVGTLPSVASILLLERIYVILYALIPLGAFYGYKLLKGRMNRFAFASSLISGVLNVFVLNFMVFAITFFRAYGILPVQYLLYTFFTELNAAGMVMDFAFLALGLVFCGGRISRTARGDAAAAADAEGTLLPLQEQTWPQ